MQLRPGSNWLQSPPSFPARIAPCAPEENNSFRRESIEAGVQTLQRLGRDHPARGGDTLRPLAEKHGHVRGEATPRGSFDGSAAGVVDVPLSALLLVKCSARRVTRSLRVLEDGDS